MSMQQSDSIDKPMSTSCFSFRFAVQIPMHFSICYALILLTTFSIDDKIACRFLHKSRPFLVHLNIRGCTELTRPTFRSISECRNLQDLNISHCDVISDDDIGLVLQSCRILIYLNVSYTPFSDSALSILSKHCTNLQFLSMAGCINFTEKGILFLTQSECAGKLTYLDLSECEQITATCYEDVAKWCPNVKYLLLNDLPSLNDESFLPLAESMTDLRSLYLIGTSFLTDASLKMIARNRKLEKLRIEGNQRITDSGMRILAKSCPNLRHLYVVNCLRISDSSLKAFSNLRGLTVLNVADCTRVTDVGVRYIIDGPSGPSVRELNLTNCVKLTDQGLVSLHKRCLSLNYLSLCYCEHISETGIELLGQAPALFSLDVSGSACGDQGFSGLGANTKFRDVSVSECYAVTDLGLQKFAQNCNEIERLDLSHCQQLTDGAIKNLAFSCRTILVLNLAGCRALTDLSMQYLSGVCHNLVTLDLSGCILLSDKSIKYLRKGCKRLRRLTLLYCRGIKRVTALKMNRFVGDVQHSSEDVPGYYGY